jgi:hypothetical protein
MAATGKTDALESALGELYAVDPAEFVATRKRLAADLRTAGEQDAAKTLLAARRPTTAAWALNQLSRRQPALVETFLDAAGVLQAAQVGGGDDAREAIRDATRAHREALAAAADGALAVLGSRATEAFRAQILATLHAASVDASVSEQLRQGRLFREVTGATGFPEGPTLSLVPDLEPEPAPTPAKKRSPPKRTPDGKAARSDAAAETAQRAEEQRIVRERQAAAALATRRAEAEAAWEAAQDEATAAETAAQEAHEHVKQLERELDEARRDAGEEDGRAVKARREAARLARAVTKLG